jgi:plastocyanin
VTHSINLRKLLYIAAFLAAGSLAGLFVGCAPKPAAAAPPATAPATQPSTAAAGPTVSIDNFTFSPQVLTVSPGTTVTWVNHDDVPHTATSTTKVFRSKALDTDDRFSFTFTAPGSFSYFCAVHPHMTGTVIVK